MTSGQTRVLVLLLALFGLEVAVSPAARAVVKDLRGGNLAALVSDTGSTTGGAPGVTGALIGYSVGALALLALAAVAPRLATWIALLLLAEVMITHGNTIVQATTTATNGLHALAQLGQLGQPAQTAPQK